MKDTQRDFYTKHSGNCSTNCTEHINRVGIVQQTAQNIQTEWELFNKLHRTYKHRGNRGKIGFRAIQNYTTAI